MNESELREIVDVIFHNRASSLGRPHELMESLKRKKLPGESFSIIEPLLRSKDRLFRKQAIDIVGKMKTLPTALRIRWRKRGIKLGNMVFRKLARKPFVPCSG